MKQISDTVNHRVWCDHMESILETKMDAMTDISSAVEDYVEDMICYDPTLGILHQFGNLKLEMMGISISSKTHNWRILKDD